LDNLIANAYMYRDKTEIYNRVYEVFVKSFCLSVRNTKIN